VTKIHDLLTDKEIEPAPAAGRGFGGFRGRGPGAPSRTSFAFTVLPHSYIAFATK